MLILVGLDVPDSYTSGISLDVDYFIRLLPDPNGATIFKSTTSKYTYVVVVSTTFPSLLLLGAAHFYHGNKQHVHLHHGRIDAHGLINYYYGVSTVDSAHLSHDVLKH